MNIGDTYCGGHPGGSIHTGITNRYDETTIPQQTAGRPQGTIKGYKQKCLLGIPERLVLALVDDGWIWRNRIAWYKKNHMPGSQKDRLTCSWEYVYFFAKNNQGSDWYIYGNEPNPEKYPKKHKIWQSVPERFRHHCWHKKDIPKRYLCAMMRLDYYYDLDIIREKHEDSSMERYKRALEYGSTFAPESKAAELKKKKGNVVSHAPKSIQGMFNGQKMAIQPKKDGICAVPKNIEKDWRQRNIEQGRPDKPPKGVSLGGGQTGLLKRPESPPQGNKNQHKGIWNLNKFEREKILKRGNKGGVVDDLFVQAGIDPNDTCLMCGRTYRRHCGLQSGKTKLMLCIKPNSSKYTPGEELVEGLHHGSHHHGRAGFENLRRKKTADEETFKVGGMRQAPEPGEPNAFNVKGKNPSDVIITERVEANIEHFKKKGQGGHFLYGGIDSPQAKHNNLKGKNPGDVLIQGEQTVNKQGHSGYFDNNGNPKVDFAKGNNPGDVITTKHDVAVNRHGSYTDPLHKKAYSTSGKNPGDTLKIADDFWPITTTGFKEAHFAVFPPSLLIRPILSSCPEGGVVLDPFNGAGTTCLVANVLGRNYIGIDINSNYKTMAERRINNPSEQRKVWEMIKKKYPDIYLRISPQKTLFD